MDDEDLYEADLGVTAVTLIIRDDDNPPEIELGGCSISYAAILFRKAADRLEDLLTSPDIYNGGVLIATDEPEYIFDTDEDDD